jgi:hypothetical protein
MDEEHYATEYPVPDLTPYRRGNTGIDYVHTFDSGRPGPHVMINALTHGNEVCGAYAVDQLFCWEARPALGRLTLSFANVDAFARFSVERPADTRWVDEDFNRVWSDDKLDGARTTSELVRARALRPVVASADLLLDLHSMHLPAPPVMIAGPHAKGRDLSRRVGLPAFVISDSGHATGARVRGADRARHVARVPAGGGDHGGRILRCPSGARVGAAAVHPGDPSGHHPERAVRVHAALDRHGDDRARRHGHRARWRRAGHDAV